MGIDWWTLTLQTVNVLILVWILSRFFFRPVANIVARRQEEASRLLSDAVAARQQAAEIRADADRTHAGLAAERDRLIGQAQEAARIEKANLLMQASQEVAKLHSEAESAIARDRVAAEDAIIAHASELAVEIARRLLGRLSPGAASAAFLGALIRELRALPAEQRASFISPDHCTEVVTASPLSESETDLIRNTLGEALGSTSRFKFRTDPALIAGLELYGASMIVHNSWRSDLDRLSKELDCGGQLGAS